ncbi:hypothetical protein LY78DRAFT_648927 [Colletotrichum sublineola]|nr:hypothetical protein LY78DRAFT_648927 [Colletotrichum sublineola]
MALDNIQNDTPTPPSDQPGKVLSEKELARKIRKRELDRRAQRQSRARTRNRLAELEAQVKELRKDDSTRLSTCMEHLATITRERDSLIDAFKAIEQAISNHVLPIRQTPRASLPFPTGQSRSLSDPRVEMLTRPTLHSCSTPISLPPETPSATGAHIFHGSSCGDEFGLVGTMPNEFSAFSAPISTPDSQDFIKELEDDDEDEDPDNVSFIVPPSESPCECAVTPTLAGSAPSKANIWRTINQVLTKRHHVPKEAQADETADDEDVPVRVLLEGWDVVAKSRPLSKLWKKLRRIDEMVFFNCPLTVRLAVLLVMHVLLKYDSYPTPEQYAKVPAWFLRRPSQKIPHSYGIDFIVWPGLRERFVFGQHAYCKNQFWELLAHYLHVLWPFEFRDTYRKSVVTGQYQISPMFEQRVMDINAWTMDRDFIEQFPELIADMPVFQSVGQSLTPVPTSSQQAYLLQLKKRKKQPPVEQATEEEPIQDDMGCTQPMQMFPGSLYSMAPPVFMTDYTPQGFDTNGISYGSTPEYY